MHENCGFRKTSSLVELSCKGSGFRALGLKDRGSRSVEWSHVEAPLGVALSQPVMCFQLAQRRVATIRWQGHCLLSPAWEGASSRTSFLHYKIPCESAVQEPRSAQ